MITYKSYRSMLVLLFLLSVNVLADVEPGDIIDDTPDDINPLGTGEVIKDGRKHEKRGFWSASKKVETVEQPVRYGGYGSYGGSYGGSSGYGASGSLGYGTGSYGIKTSGYAYPGSTAQKQTYPASSNDMGLLSHALGLFGVKKGSSTAQSTHDFLLNARQPQISAYGACPAMPLPANVQTSCQRGQCELTCPYHYTFPDTTEKFKLACIAGSWILRDTDYESVPPCQPVCLPACQNNGICWEPGICKCSENFYGPLCQYKKSICSLKVPVPKYAQVSCRNNICNAVCMRGFQFPDGSNITNFECLDGQWIHKATGLTKSPDCTPTCSPACENNGQCISFNVCQCTKQYRGDHCQYSINRCNVTNTGFNGNFKCAYDNEEAKCNFACPDMPQLKVEGNLNIEYTCKYANAEFLPKPLPKCIYPPNTMRVGMRSEQYTKYTKPIMAGAMFSHSMEITSSREKLLELIAKYQDLDDDTKWWSSEEFLISPGSYALYESSDVDVITDQTPKSALCATWGGNNVKTFDGLVYKTTLSCSNTLLTDTKDAVFDIKLRACPTGSGYGCPHALDIYWQSVVYRLQNLNNTVQLSTGTKILPIPVQVVGMKVVAIAQKIQITLESIGLQIDWDHHQYLAVQASPGLWGKVGGLCGSLDGNFKNDLVSRHGVLLQSVKAFVDSWKVEDKSESCLMETSTELEFDTNACETSKRKQALDICGRLLANTKLTECIRPLNYAALLQNCVDDYCNCPNREHPETCNCDALAMLAKECIFRGVELKNGWRNLEICPINCKYGRIYMACGPDFEPTCDSAVAPTKDNCVEGCFCPEGTVQYKDACIVLELCPCSMKGREFKPDSKVKKSCNTCVCKAGKWSCSDEQCGARCGAVGDPHYQTFDGKRYNFMGKCSYYLLKTENITVETENVACSGALSEGLSLEVTSDDPSCTKSVTIKLKLKNGAVTVIKLGQGLVTQVNDKEVNKFPKVVGAGEVLLRQASSTFVTVDFPNGLRIFWDGVSRVYVDAPPSFREKTSGLCGTFNSNTQDDFLTPEGDIETAIEPFADKWRTNDMCEFDAKTSNGPHPCSADPAKRTEAEKHCAWILDDVFQDCHWTVEPEQYYEDCLYDVCACKDEPAKCFCPILAAYGDECTRQGIKSNWRLVIKDCAIKCPLGQIYEECGNSCVRTCEDLSTKTNCTLECIEGCHCPHDEYLNENNECVAQKKCHCSFDGAYFKPGYKEVRMLDESMKLCTCENAAWQCVAATEEDKQNYPAASELRAECAERTNAQFSKCTPKEPKTCKNLNEYVEDLSDCKPGCSCLSDYVYDSATKSCVLPSNCSCQHASKTYADGEQMKENCNICACKSGNWICSQLSCETTCSVWGDSHFTTFDNHDFDFQGACDYVLSKGVADNGDGFTITIQNVLCGTLGVTCSKSVEISLSGSVSDSLLLSASNAYNTELSKSTISQIRETVNAKGHAAFHVYKAGVFIVIEVIPLGLQVKWDEGTRVYVKLGKEWKNKVSGLCGNYNDNAMDDMKTPAQSLETSPLIFGHAWKVQNFCTQPMQPIDACKAHPERETWAQLKCGVLKSDTFKDCHKELPVETYFKRCIFDSCACDQGGDCECLCTAIAAYAQACSEKDISIRWRTTHFCPMQCDAHCSDYEACTPACAVETCNNFLDQGLSERMCNQEHCIEGCKIRPCEEGMIYLNDSYLECVPKAECKPVCLIQNGTIYYEGDITYQDACSTCRCSKRKEVCSGVKCAELIPTQAPILSYEGTTQTPLNTEADTECVQGWTRWFDNDSDNTNKEIRLNDEEQLPNYDRFESIYGTCRKEFMKKIECRVVNTHQASDSLNENVNCNLDSGLNCVGQCHDYEIRAFCQCFKLDETTPETIETPAIGKACDNVLAEYKEYPGDCHKFLHCQPKSVSGDWHYVEKTCGEFMMFNPTMNICDHILTVQQIKPNCGTKIIENEPYTQMECPDNMIMSNCANQCEHTCHYYAKILSKRGLCQAGEHCKPGCVPKERADCASLAKYWRDENTCVENDECPCMDNSENYVQPHMPVVSESEVCQCISNLYSCVPNVIIANTTTVPEEDLHNKLENEVVFPSTLTPPARCDAEHVVRMINNNISLGSNVFSASSELGPLYEAKFARLPKSTAEQTDYSWSPKINDQMQYLQVNFEHAVPLFGVVMAGNSAFDNYVTLFKILYSYDGEAYHYLVDETGRPQMFNGPLDSREFVETMFNIPIEAKSVRVYPLKWHGSIAMRVDLLGCRELEITTHKPTTVSTPSAIELQKAPECSEPMGIETGQMKPTQLRASSIWHNTKLGKKAQLIDLLKLSSPTGWRPLLNTPNEYIEFDFLNPRNISGFITKGGPDGWVSGFKVFFSKNKVIWNKVLSANGQPRVFIGNHDANTEQIHIFQKQILTQYFKIVPAKWQQNINMRVEPLGCFEPYAEVKTEIKELDKSKPKCLTCAGIKDITTTNTQCKCQDGLYWDGSKCVQNNLCPCVENYIPYAVGAKFENAKCEECVCILGGHSSCKPKKCPACEADLRAVISSGCFCKCEPCPKLQKLCPSSGDCIPELLWCNGVRDCADDEDDTCQIKFEIKPEIKKNETKLLCPEPICPPNMMIKLIEKKARKMSTMFSSITTKLFTLEADGHKITKTKVIESSEELIPMPEEQINIIEEDLCNEFTCIPERNKLKSNSSVICVEPKCPENYDVEVDMSNVKSGDCAKYTCVLKPQKDDVCEISGSSFTTFDGTEFKYLTCSHILARDLKSSQWSISVQALCQESQNKVCRKVIIIKDLASSAMLSIMPNMKVNFNGFEYSVQQLINSPVCKASFVISQPGNTVLVVSQRHGFWVLYDDIGYAKIGLSSKYIKTVDGLCGYYNGIASDDKRGPNGTLIPSTMKFGDSWYDKQIPKEQCQPRTCSLNMQTKSLALCNTIMHPTFKKCGKSVNYKQFVSKCIETVCDCLQANNGDVNSCKCNILQDFVKKCLTVNPNVQLNTWRAIHQCEISCPAPLVHSDCFKRRCELSCNTLNSEDCPIIEDACFAGCYCPEGTVRKDNNCVSVNECKDCVCNSFSAAKYYTYDHKSFIFDGNCTYLLSRDILLPGVHTFQIYVSMDDCWRLGHKDLPKGSSCAKSYHVFNGDHIVHITFNSNALNPLQIAVDGFDVTKIPYKDSWLQLRLLRNQVLLLSLPEAHVELTANFEQLQFSLEVPSIKYGNKMEGLCGNCDGNPNDDLQLNAAKQQTETAAAATLAEVINSWQAKEPRLGINFTKCADKPLTAMPPETKNCVDAAATQDTSDPCLMLYDQQLFGKCNMIIDPSSYVQSCQQDTCKQGRMPNVTCDALTAYSQACLRLGICLNWRGPEFCPYKCPVTMNYKPCSCIKTCETIAASNDYDAVIMKTNTFVKTIELDEMCALDEQVEGCFCPLGQVRDGDKCVTEDMCLKCDDGLHKMGEKWSKDKCTTCECSTTGKVECLTQQCMLEENICAEGYIPKKIVSEEECCARHICVPELKLPPAKVCLEPIMPICGPGQFKEQKTAANGCPQYVCACKPKEECEQLVPPRDLKPGEKLLIEDTGCCPTQKIVCDKKLCPQKFELCAQAHFELVTKHEHNQCCPSYICELPKDLCMVEYSGSITPVVRKVFEKWTNPNDPCKHEVCNYGSNGTAQVQTSVEICDTQCNIGFTYVRNNSNKCCGECSQTHCVHETKLYEPDQIWHSEDNCTLYKCEASADNALIVSSMKEACPDVSHCAAESLIDNGGCCKYCKTDPIKIEAKTLCLPISLVANETINLVRIYKPGNGNCHNLDPIVGFTECSGSCDSGSKYNKGTLTFDKICNCCNVHSYKKITVPLVCENGFKLNQEVSIPSGCACQPCIDSATYHLDAVDVRLEPLPIAQLRAQNSQEIL